MKPATITTIKRLLCHSLVLGVMLLSIKAEAKRIIMKPSINGDVYGPAVTWQPGDTLVYEGVLRSTLLTGVIGTPQKPVVITGGTFTGNGAYTIVFDSTCKYFKVYGVTVKGNNTCPAFAFNGPADHYEVFNCDISGATGGFLHNSLTDLPKKNIYLHDNYIHDCENPRDNGRFEAFYYGNTGKKDPGGFENLRIENNRIENVSGDGVQVCQTRGVSVKGNHIKAWGLAQLLWQRTGILIGNDVYGSTVEGNTLEGGKGTAYQNFSGGFHSYKNNVHKNIDLTAIGDNVVYMSARYRGFTIDFSSNTFESTKGYRVITNATPDSLTIGSVFCGNVGVSAAQVSLNKKDSWGCVILPLPEPTPEPAPIEKPKKKKGKYKVYNVVGKLVKQGWDLDEKTLDKGKLLLIRYEDGTSKKYFGL